MPGQEPDCAVVVPPFWHPLRFPERMQLKLARPAGTFCSVPREQNIASQVQALGPRGG